MKTTLLGLGVALMLFCFNTPQNCQAAALPAASSGANNNQFACKPPFLASAAKPNIHFVLDVTGSMAEHVYVTQSQVYVPETNYYGLFKNDIYYTYSAANGRWEEQPSTTCTFTDLIGGPNCVSGNLLNYVTTNKIDIVRKILTGGRTITGDTTVLEHEQANSSGNIGGVGEPTTGCTFDTSASAGKVFISSGTVSTSIKSSNVNKIIKVKNGSTLTRNDLGSFIADGWKAGMTFTTSGFSNNGTWTIAAGGVAAKVLTLTTSTGGSNSETKQVTLTGPTTVAALNCKYVTTDIASAGTMTVNQTTKKFIRNDGGSFSTDGWLAGMQFRSSGFSDNENNRIWTIAVGGVSGTEITVVETGMKTNTNSRAATFVSGINSYVKIKTSTATNGGIIQNFYPSQADLEISFFSTASGIAVDYTGGGVANSNTAKNQSLANYVTAINQTVPGGFTNTGPAMLAAQKFFQQDTTISATAPSSGTALIHKGFGDSDPYFEPPATGTASVANSTVATCRKSFVILISDGQWNSPDTNASSDPVWPAFAMHRRDGTNDLRIDTGVGGVTDVQSVTTYTVYAFGGNDVAGRNAMITTAIYGGFDDIDNNSMPYPFTNTASPFRTPSITSGTTTSLDTTNLDYPLAECDPDGTWNAGCAEWDQSPGPTTAHPTDKHTGLPYNFFEADNGDQLADTLIKTVNKIMARVASSAAASILGNNDNAGATLVQAMFYPEKQFDGTLQASWIGEVQAFWYYLDPKLDHITIRVDNGPTSDKKLVLTEDQIAEFHFDGVETKVFQFADATGDGIKDNPLDAKGQPTSPDTSDFIENVSTLWRAGRSLWALDPADRTIFTNNPTGTSAAKLDFITDNAATMQPYMDTTIASDIVAYLRGSDTNSSYDVRQRTVQIGLTDTHPWKLGDVINSTPKMISEVRLNSYNLKAPSGYSDNSYDKFIKSKDYGQRGTAFVGANDGMLHAFKTGSNFIGSTQGIVAEIRNPDGSAPTDLGKEVWAFVPKNSLPYLQYLMLPDYKHMYYVDSTPLVVDASIGMTNPNACQRTYTAADGTSITEAVATAIATNPCTTTTASTYHLCARRTTLTRTDNNKLTTNKLNYSVTGTDCGTSWRTVLIGSAGLGGATSNTKAETAGVSMSVATAGTLTRTAGSFATDGWAVGKKFTAGGFTNNPNNSTFKISAISGTGNMITFTPTTGLVAENNVVASLTQNVVKTPFSNLGYSSYFALDVSEDVPQLMWEFSDPRLGFTTVTPAVMRIRDTNDTPTSGSPRNGKWYAVFASGPTGPIDGPSSAFLGRSEQPLTIFVLDLKTGALVRTFNKLAPTDAFNLANQSVHTQITSMPDDAFASSMSASSIDVDKASSAATGNYSDDAAYIGYSRASVPTTAEPVVSWNKGGVLRLLTYNDASPANWKPSTVIDGIGPVTSTVTKLQDITNHKLWLFFGTGRYFVKGDDATNAQTLFGIQDPCYYSESTDNFGLAATACTTSIAASTTAAGLTSTSAPTLVDKSTATVANVAAANAALASGKLGWYINLGAASGSNYPKRVITNPVASTTGVITFTTFTPSTDVCTYGGTTSVWAVKYDTGGVGSVNLKGQILIQLSTGAFQQIDVATAFTETASGVDHNLNRETAQFKGVPPKSEPAITTNSNHTPSKRILHIQEK